MRRGLSAALELQRDIKNKRTIGLYPVFFQTLSRFQQTPATGPQRWTQSISQDKIIGDKRIT